MILDSNNSKAFGGASSSAHGTAVDKDKLEDLDPHVDTAIYDAIDQAWRSVPLGTRRKMLANVKANLEMMSDGQTICSGTAMSGTDIMVHVTQCELHYLHRELDYPKHILKPLFACDTDPNVQGFLADQFPDLPLLVNSVAELSNFKAQNLLKKNEWRVIPDVELIGMGFVCTSVTKQSSKSKTNRGCVSRGEGATGISFGESASAVVKRRALLSFLENVPELELEFDDEDTGLGTSDLEYIIEHFKKQRMSAIHLKHNAVRGGSRARRIRLWIIVLDQVLTNDELRELQDNAQTFLALFHVEPMEPERFLLDRDTVQAMTSGLDSRRAPKRSRVHADWKQEHEALCSLKGLRWPICVENTDQQCFDGFKEREAEQVAIAQLLFPATTSAERDHWQFFDTNHSMPRVMWTEGDKEPRNPWKDTCPTMTCGTVVAMRRNEVVRMMDPLEMMRMQGWDLGMYEGQESPYHQASALLPKHVSKMSGNMWNGFSFSIILKVGLALPLKADKRFMNVVADEKKLEQEEDEEEDDDEGGGSSESD